MINNFLLVSALVLSAEPDSPVAPDGASLYKAQCARCHGGKGEGAKKFGRPLQGDLSLLQLSKLVRETMPEDSPNSLSEAEALAISKHMYDGFYSITARERVKPARIDLTRLTVRQYRNNVADLIGAFRGPISWTQEVPVNEAEKKEADKKEADKKEADKSKKKAKTQNAVQFNPGLKATYHASRSFKEDKKVLERIDATVNFDFGVKSPLDGKLEDDNFSIRWQGSLLPTETGEHDIIVETEHSVRLWVNDTRGKFALIDAWVKSGNDNVYRNKIYLIAGRPVTIQLEYSKSQQGVKDQMKKKPPEKSSIRLKWIKPHGVLEVIPKTQLSSKTTPEQFLVSTRFPPDDRSLGWERGSSISKEWDAAITEGAIETTQYVLSRLDELAGIQENEKDREKKLRAFVLKFVTRGFRRPLTEEQKKLVIDKSFELHKDKLDLAIQRIVLLTLKSPFFLYREVAGGSDDFDKACRLSFSLTDSMPDEILHQAANSGSFKTAEQVKSHAERLLRTDPRAQAKLQQFMMIWLRADQPHEVQKNMQKYPGFEDVTVADLKTSLELFLSATLQSENADYRQLFNTDKLYLNGRLSKLYGGNLPADADFTPLPIEADQRAGVLTHPYLMANFSGAEHTSPIHRGVFLARGILGVALRPPPEAVSPIPPDLHPGMTTRERVALQTKAATCMTCHGVINPLGFTLENFDAIGRFRKDDAGRKIDAEGEYMTREGKNIKLTGAKELAKFLAESSDAHEAFVEQMFHHLVQQPVRAYGAKTLDDLEAGFVKNEFNIRKLAIQIAVTGAMNARKNEVEKSKVEKK